MMHQKEKQEGSEGGGSENGKVENLIGKLPYLRQNGSLFCMTDCRYCRYPSPADGQV